MHLRLNINIWTTPLQPSQLLPFIWVGELCGEEPGQTFFFFFFYFLSVFKLKFYMQSGAWAQTRSMSRAEGLESRSTGGHSAPAVCAGVLHYDVWLWNMLDIHSLCFFNHLLGSEKAPIWESSKTAWFPSRGRACGLPFLPTPPPDHSTRLHPLQLKAEGHSQRLFIEAALMWGLTADISNIKLWATSEPCRQPPVRPARLFIPSQHGEDVEKRERTGRERKLALYLDPGQDWAVTLYVHY